MWTKHGFHMDIMWFQCGHNVVTTWTPHGSQVKHHMVSMWLSCAHHEVSRWSPQCVKCGHHMISI